MKVDFVLHETSHYHKVAVIYFFCALRDMNLFTLTEIYSNKSRSYSTYSGSCFLIVNEKFIATKNVDGHLENYMISYITNLLVQEGQTMRTFCDLFLMYRTTRIHHLINQQLPHC